MLYALSIIGFGTATSEGFTSLDSFNVLEGGTASAGLFARVGRACVPAGGVLVQEAVTDFGSCGETSVGKKNPTWGGFGKRLDGALHADSGERLDLECVGEAGTLPSFVLRYTSAEGSQHVVGVCPFEGGCNEVRFWHAGDSDGNGQPDCLVRTRWISKDYGSYDDRNPNPWTDISEPTDPYIDWAETIFDVNSTKVSKNDYKYTKLADYPISCSSGASPEGTLARTLAVDPLLGPETDAFFSAVLERFRLQPPGEAKGEASRRRCDLNGDGICDAADRARFAASLGSCRGEANYNPLPDGDADGCVTAQDETALFIADADGDEVPDDVDACPASNRSATVAIAGCESGVANRQLARGCTHTDEIAKCAATATNHGRFTSCVAKVGNALVSLGVITDAQQSAVQSCAARARIP